MRPAIVKALKAEFASTVAGGQGQLKGKILRIAHLGYYDVTDILGLLGTLEIVLRRLGHALDARAAGVGAPAREPNVASRPRDEAQEAHGGAARSMSYKILVLEGITDRGLADPQGRGLDRRRRRRRCPRRSS